MANFTEPEWNQIHDHIDGKEAEYGFPEQRTDSVVLGSFNIRDFGSRHKANGDQNRSDGAWRLLKRMCERFDFLAIQEVEDNIESLAFLVSQLPGNREFVHSDVTGAVRNS